MANTCNCCGCFLADGASSVVSGTGDFGEPFKVEVTDPMFASQRYAVRRQRSSNQSIPNDTLTLVDFTTAAAGSFDRGGFFTAPGTFTIPSTGIYAFGMTIGFADNATGYRSMQVIKNDLEIILSSDGHNTGAGAVHYLTSSSSAPLNAADTLKLQVRQTSGAPLDIVTNAEQSPIFWAIYIGRFVP